MTPYRTPAGTHTKPVCDRPWWLGGGHRRVVLEVLKSGDGPDYASKRIACSRCSATGWTYCDGTESWGSE